jgi:hypothetical protein
MPASMTLLAKLLKLPFDGFVGNHFVIAVLQ